MDLATLAAVDYETYKANLDLVTQVAAGGDSVQFMLNVERQKHAIPLLEPMVGAMLTATGKVQEWSSLPEHEKKEKVRLAQLVRDIETAGRLQGAIAVLFSFGDVVLNNSMKEVLRKELSTPPEKKPSKKRKKGRKR